VVSCSVTTQVNHFILHDYYSANNNIHLGVISGVLTMPTFPAYFGMDGDAAHIATVKGNIVSVLQAGCCAGAIIINPLAGNFNIL
jgi:hypothetical protein